MTHFAFECFADEDVFHVLRTECQLPLVKRHSYNKGEVVKDVLKVDRATLGMVDEDPGSTAPRALGETRRRSISHDLDLRTKGEHHLLVLKPRLEDCFVRGMALVGLQSKLSTRAEDLHRLLTIEHRSRHETFRQELIALLKASRDQGVATFITDLEDTIRQLQAPS